MKELQFEIHGDNTREYILRCEQCETKPKCMKLISDNKQIKCPWFGILKRLCEIADKFNELGCTSFRG